MASSSAECSLDKPPCSLVCGQDSTMCDIVWVSTQEHWSESESFRFFLQWPCLVRKRFRRDHCCRGRAKPSCRIVGSSTRCALTTEADFQDFLHWLLMSTGSDSRHKGFWDVRRYGGGLEMSWCSGQLSWARAFTTSLSVASFLRRAGGSMLARTGSLLVYDQSSLVGLHAGLQVSVMIYATLVNTQTGRQLLTSWPKTGNKLRRFDVMKLETENVKKTMGTPRKINAILLNININRPKLVNMCRYKLATYWQNFTELHITWVKILQKVFFWGGATFLTHTVYIEKIENIWYYRYFRKYQDIFQPWHRVTTVMYCNVVLRLPPPNAP